MPGPAVDRGSGPKQATALAHRANPGGRGGTSSRNETIALRVQRNERGMRDAFCPPIYESRMNTRKRAKLAFLFSILAGGAACAPGGCCAPAVQTGTGIHVVNDNVRACDLVFRAGGEEVPRVSFGSAVIGQHVPKAPNLGASFTAREDASLEGQEIGRLVFTGTSTPAELVSARCFDAAGAPVEGDVVRLSE